MIEIKFKWGERQPTWVTNASQYARNELDLCGDDELQWLQSTLGYYPVHGSEEITLVFEDDKDYTMTILKWA